MGRGAWCCCVCIKKKVEYVSGVLAECVVVGMGRRPRSSTKTLTPIVWRVARMRAVFSAIVASQDGGHIITSLCATVMVGVCVVVMVDRTC